MQRTSNDTMNSSHLRATVRTWLDNAGKRPVWLAQEAGLNPSILSRFLNQRTQLDQVSALKLYSALQHRMTHAERQDYLEAAGLQGLMSGIASMPAVDPLPRPDGPYDPMALGMRYLHAAEQAMALSPLSMATVELYASAERAFGPASTVAAYAACRAGISLSIMGEVERADSELVRAGTVYADIMDVPTRVYYYGTRGYIEFDRARLDVADRWYRLAIAAAQRAGVPELAIDAMTYMVLIPLEIAHTAPDTPGVSARLADADCWIETLLQRRDLTEAYASHCHYLRAQLREAEGRHEDAESDRRVVRNLAVDIQYPGQRHHDIDTAELELEQGDTVAARRLAAGALEDWSVMRYTNGMARSSRVLATAALQESHTNEALELSLAAACINPYGTYQDRLKLDETLRSAVAAVRVAMRPKDFGHLVKDLRVKAESQQGAFSPLSAVAPTLNTDLDAVFGKVAE